MLVAVYPLVFVILGLLLYGFAPGKLNTIGLWMFVTSWLVLMQTLAHTTFRIGGG